MTSRHTPMSIEAVLDQERREVLAILEGQSSNRNRTASSRGSGTTSPPPGAPPRSMLNIGGDYLAPAPTQESRAPSSSAKNSRAAAPVRSMLDLSTPPPPVRSMLDVDTPPSPASSGRQALSNPSSPVEANFRAHAVNTNHLRSFSDAATRPVSFGPRSFSSRLDPTSDYQFGGIITNNKGQALPKRVTQGGKHPHAPAKMNPSLAEVFRSSDPSNLMLPGDRGRLSGGSGPSGPRQSSQSKSPSGRWSLRSLSPHNSSLLPNRALSPAGRNVVLENNIEYKDAYKRLTNANLARAGGSLGELTKRKKPEDPQAEMRLEKDYIGPDGELLAEDSSDDHDGSSSEDEAERGRKTARIFDQQKSSAAGSSQDGGSFSPDAQRKTFSLLAAAEEERLEVAQQSKYKSLLEEPAITITKPSEDRVKQRSGVHPVTSFDNPPLTGSGTPADSDTEAELTDISRAQKLSFAMTQIMSNPESHRTLQIITRGEYGKIVQDAEEEGRTLRKYLVATDMSEESTHALEWAVGTVLRDGDTLIAIWCVDEESGIGAGDTGQVPDEAKAMKEQATAIHNMASNRNSITPGGSFLPLTHLQPFRPSPLMHSTDASGNSTSPSPVASINRERSKAEEDRHRAVQDISERVTKLLRKTRLQVKVVVEVVHCKNPRHLITEVIDVVNPTLVILGSRGRSALKGVILGSFSNYLVTKSSVPVMVARKRLRKQSKYKRLPATQQINNITHKSARILANAKVD